MSFEQGASGFHLHLTDKLFRVSLRVSLTRVIFVLLMHPVEVDVTTCFPLEDEGSRDSEAASHLLKATHKHPFVTSVTRSEAEELAVLHTASFELKVYTGVPRACFKLPAVNYRSNKMKGKR